MRRSTWLMGLGLVAATALAASPPPAPSGPTDPAAYDELGTLAVMHQGRRKPLDTLARESLKQIHGSSSIVQRDAKGKVAATWPAVAALLDWSARPTYWDDQDILLVQYLPLKQLILADPIRDALKAAAGRASVEGSKAALTTLAGSKVFDATGLSRAALLAGLDPGDKAALGRYASKLAGDIKWLSPSEVEDAEFEVDGVRRPFIEWAGIVFRKDRQVRASNNSGHLKSAGASVESLTPLEEGGLEAFHRLFHYKALRSRDARSTREMDVDATPRPLNDAYVAFTAAALRKAAARGELTKLEEDVLDTFGGDDGFIATVKQAERKAPGVDKAFDARYLAWIRDSAGWLSTRLMLDSGADELALAGFPKAKLEAFRSAWSSLEGSEKADPGHASLASARALTASARDLAAAVSTDYVTAKALAVESHYNRFAPFVKAPMAYGVAVLALVLALSLSATAGGPVAGVRKGLFGVGMVALLAGIGLEIYGFSLRVRITGWAPVTNMYETVIWVALIASIIGVALEAVYRKGYAALGASGVALLSTVLAATVSEALLDPNIKNLNPVLRSNFWLGTHVLTIVSSYAAFALAMGVGLVGVFFYLTATYRRSADLTALSMPMLPGLLLLLPGAMGVAATYGHPAGFLASDAGYYLVCGVAGAGGMLTIAGLFALVGELANRAPSRTATVGSAVAVAGLVGVAASTAGVGLGHALVPASLLALLGASTTILGLFGLTCQIRSAGSTHGTAEERASQAAPARRAAFAEVGGEGSVATLARPTVAEIRARQGAYRAPIDPRGEAIQATAARIKPISVFLYRAMQVGVLLVALGTFLGGFWADKSWGRFWGWDAKEVWALITLLVYLVPLHGRFAGWVNSFGLVVASQVCFGSVLMAWYGVNFVLGVGLHSYGFSEGGGQGVVLAATASVLAVVLGAAWRRRLSQPAALLPA